jgi:hypothetical protein
MMASIWGLIAADRPFSCIRYKLLFIFYGSLPAAVSCQPDFNLDHLAALIGS